jgi:hypothetical protein
MAIIQISKIQIRTGANTDLPQLDVGELGFTTDTRQVFIGNDTTLYPRDGLDLSLTELVTKHEGILDLGPVSNIKISGGTNGYVLQTDGTGNLTWTNQASGGSNSTPGGSNTQVQFNDAGTLTGTSDFLYDKATNTLTLTGNISVNTVNTGNIVGVLTTQDQPNITSVGTLTSLVVTGNISSGNANLGNLVTANYFVGFGNNLSNIQASNITGQVSNAIVARTVYLNNQPNITSVGTLSSLTISGTTNLGAVGNITITGGSTDQILQTDGTGILSWVNKPTITPGGSNTQIQFNHSGSFGGTNLLTYDSTAHILTVVGNIVATNITGSLSSNIQTSIDTLGQLTSLTVSGISELGPIANVKIHSGTSGQLLSTDGTGNLSWVTYDYGDSNVNTYLSTYVHYIANATHSIVADSANGVAWLHVNGKPTTLAGYGITDSYTNSNVASYLSTFTGNIKSGNANLGNLVVANYFSGSGSLLTDIYGPIMLSHHSHTHSISLGYYDVIYQSMDVDSDGSYDNTTGIYTPTIAGYYQINATMNPRPYAPSSFGGFILELYKNSTKVYSGNPSTFDASLVNGPTNISTIVYLNGTDSIHCKLNCVALTYGSFTTNIGSEIQFQAVWIRP